jgi:outer membrane protein assembly factor BamB
VVSSFPSPGDSPSGLGWDGSTIWVANLRTATGGGHNRISQHDPLTGAEVGGFYMRSGSYYHGLSFDPSGNLWADDFYDEIVQLSRTGTVLRTMPAAGRIYGLAFVPATGRLLAVSFSDRTLYELDATSGAIQRSVSLSIPDSSTGGAAWDGTALWVVGVSTRTIYRVDPKSGAVLAQFAATGRPEGIAYDGACLWISDTQHDRIYRVDHGEATLPSCPPTAAAVDAGTGSVPDAGSAASPDAGSPATPDAGAGVTPDPDPSGAPDGAVNTPTPPAGGGAGGAERPADGDRPGGCGLAEPATPLGLGLALLALAAVAAARHRRR